MLLIVVCMHSEAQRIVSLVPSVTQTLQQLGADSKVVARTSLCPVAQNGQTVIVGDVLTVNVEKIVAMKPTAVVTMGFTRQEVITKLKKMGVNVVEMHTPISFDEMCEQTLYLAELANCREKAVNLIAEQRARIITLQKDMSHSNLSVFFQVGTKPLWGAYPQMYIDDMISKMGGRNIVVSGNGSVSREFVVAANPNVIVMTTMGGLWKDEVDIWKKVCSSAVIVVVDEDKAGCPTPINFVDTMEKIMTYKALGILKK